MSKGDAFEFTILILWNSGPVREEVGQGLQSYLEINYMLANEYLEETEML